MKAFDPTGLTVQLELGTPGAMVPLQSYMTHWPDLDEMFDGPKFRGSDAPIPHVAGDVPQKRIVASKVVVLEGLIRGTHNIINDPYASAVAGLQSNLNYLNYYCTPQFSPADDTTRRLRLVTSLGIKYGPVHATFDLGRAPGIRPKPITLELSMPEGGLWHTAVS